MYRPCELFPDIEEYLESDKEEGKGCDGDGDDADAMDIEELLLLRVKGGQLLPPLGTHSGNGVGGPPKLAHDNGVEVVAAEGARQMPVAARKAQSPPKKARRGNSGTQTRYKGVYSKKQRDTFIMMWYNARLKKQVYGGTYKNLEDAARAYNKAIIKHYGPNAPLNQVEGDDVLAFAAEGEEAGGAVAGSTDRRAEQGAVPEADQIASVHGAQEAGAESKDQRYMAKAPANKRQRLGPRALTRAQDAEGRTGRSRSSPRLRAAATTVEQTKAPEVLEEGPVRLGTPWTMPMQLGLVNSAFLQKRQLYNNSRDIGGREEQRMAGQELQEDPLGPVTFAGQLSGMVVLALPAVEQQGDELESPREVELAPLATPETRSLPSQVERPVSPLRGGAATCEGSGGHLKQLRVRDKSGRWGPKGGKDSRGKECTFARRRKKGRVTLRPIREVRSIAKR